MVFLLGGCLASGLDPLVTHESPDTPRELSGVVSLSDGRSIDLRASRGTPRLLVFAQEFCEVCLEETAAFREAYPQVEARDIELVTVLVGSPREDAVAWKDEHQVPWDVGYDPGLRLKNRLCPNAGTPCSLLELPGRGVVLKRVGLLHPEDVFKRVP